MEKIRHSRIKIIFGVGTIILLSLSFFSYLRINNLMRSAALVNHTNVVKLELESMFSEMKDAESAHRGYILTKDTVFLKQYYGAIANINRHISRIDLVTSDNYSQKRNNEVLKILINKRAEYMTDLMQYAGAGKITTEKLLQGKVLMDALRRQVDKMMDEEDFLLRLRTKSLTKESSLTPLFTIFLIVCSILVLIVSYYGINRELKISNSLKLNLEDSQRDLLDANNFLEEKNKSLAAMNKELESFTYISSHDLQEPLRKIQTFVTRIIDGESDRLSETGRSYLNRTHNAADRMQALIRDLLAYSRLNTEIFPLETFNFKMIVDEVIDDLEEDIAEKHVVVEVTGDPDVTIIVSQFRQLLTNLISNSIKFAKPEVAPHIVIDNKLVKGEAIPEGLSGPAYSKITISDNGIGFDPQYKNRIFEVFQRLHIMKEFPGTGIGLAIVKKIVDNHHGQIIADGELYKGAIFTLYIPV